MCIYTNAVHYFPKVHHQFHLISLSQFHFRDIMYTYIYIYIYIYYMSAIVAYLFFICDILFVVYVFIIFMYFSLYILSGIESYYIIYTILFLRLTVDFLEAISGMYMRFQTYTYIPHDFSTVYHILCPTNHPFSSEISRLCLFILPSGQQT